MTKMTSTHLSKKNWKNYRISCRIERDEDDRNCVWIRGMINGKDILADNVLNEPKNVSKAISWMLNYDLPRFLDGLHHETHYEGFAW